MLPEVLYSQCRPGPSSDDQGGSPVGNSGFVVTVSVTGRDVCRLLTYSFSQTRNLGLVSHSLAMLRSRYPELSIHTEMEKWFEDHVAFMQTSAQGKDAMSSEKHKAWYLANVSLAE